MSESGLTYPSVRWRQSIIVRIVVLCGVLVLCLFGFVYGITRVYFSQVLREAEEQTQQIANSISLRIQGTPEDDIEQIKKIKKEIGDLYDGIDIDLSPLTTDMESTRIAAEASEQGHVVVAQHPLVLGGHRLLLTVRITPRPTVQVLHAFRNKYLALLTAVFVVTLTLMIYVIAKTLRPLRELSDSCARISAGQLVDVQVRKSAGEIVALEETFNRMVSSLREKEVVEANLRQAQRLSAIGTLAAGVAHDIRNPLNAIKLLSSHARDTLGEEGEHPQAVRHLDTINKEVDRLEGIVSGFLSLAKEQELRPEPTRLDSVLAECVRLIRQDAEARGIRLITELRAGDTTLHLDSKQWTRAILNVLINAMEACPPGGRVRLFSRTTDAACEIEIRDDGPGLSKEAAERAFDAYFTTKATGTGLGLSITRAIIEEHGGRIQLSGEEGQGCQVLIVLPLKVNKP